MRALMLMFPLLFFVHGGAMASGCPGKIAQIDAIVTSGEHAELTDEELSRVLDLRAQGESLHIAGEHNASMKALEMALELLQGAD